MVHGSSNSDEHHCRNVTLLMSTGYMTWMPNEDGAYGQPPSRNCEPESTKAIKVETIVKHNIAASETKSR